MECSKIITISKEEKDKIVKRFPKAPIVRTMKQDSKRHHYWMAEEPKLMKYLNEMRDING